MKPLRILLEGTFRLFFPPICEWCGQSTTGNRLCDSCQRLLIQDAHTRLCKRCGGSIGPHVDVDRGCYRCKNDHFSFETVYRLGRYDGPLQEMILGIKTEAGAGLAVALGDLLAEVRATDIKNHQPAAIIPVPHHWRRKMVRGYNPAMVLAQRLARRLSQPVKSGVLFRQRNTPQQSRLSPTERRTNVRDAFWARRCQSLQNTTVLLVDDVLTTGATCHQAGRALRAAGCERVIVAVVARGEDVNSKLIRDDVNPPLKSPMQTEP